MVYSKNIITVHRFRYITTLFIGGGKYVILWLYITRHDQSEDRIAVPPPKVSLPVEGSVLRGGSTVGR